MGYYAKAKILANNLDAAIALAKHKEMDDATMLVLHKAKTAAATACSMGDWADDYSWWRQEGHRAESEFKDNTLKQMARACKHYKAFMLAAGVDTGKDCFDR